MYPKPVIYQVKLESGPVTEEYMLPMGHCHVLPPLGPLQTETAVVGSQQGLPCGSIGRVTMGQEAVVDGFPASPNSIQIPHPCHKGPITYEAILLQHPQQSMVLMRCGLSRSPVDLPGTKVPMVACLKSMWLTVAWVRSTRQAIALCPMPSQASASTSCLAPIEVGRGII